MLIEPALLEKELKEPLLCILDARPKADYEKGHIPGAIRVDVATWQEQGRAEKGFHDAKAWGERAGRLGIDRGSRVVVYGSRLPDAARIWWTLKYLGLREVSLLDGGWELWVKEGRSIETIARQVKPTRFEPAFQADRLEEIRPLKEAIASAKVRVLDARSREEFAGQGKGGGRIRGATHLEWKELLAGDGRFKPQGELRALFRQQGILPEDGLVCY